MRRGRPPYPDLLTPREQEVLTLIREGLTNEQIAARLGISESGARYHVSEILSKLGVSSRYEAAQWQETPRRRVFGVVPLLARLGNLMTGGRRVALGLGALAAAALAALALGVAVNELRGGTGERRAAAPTPTPGPEVLRMHELAAEAGRLVDVIAPDAELYRLLYWRGGMNESYHFHFARPDGTEVYLGRMTMPDSGVWNFTVADLDEAVSAPLDLSGVVHSLQDVSNAATTAGALPPVDDCDDVCQQVVIEAGPFGSALWKVLGARQIEEWVPCELEDGDPLQAMTCGSPVPPSFPGSPPATIPTAEPLSSAQDLQGIAEFALDLARVFEPEAYLFSLRGQPLLSARSEHWDYGFSFSSQDGSRVISVRRRGIHWVLELPQPSAFDGSPPPRFDPSAVQKGFIEVAQAVDDVVFLARPTFTLSAGDGSLFWRVEGANFGNDTVCTLPDQAPPSDLTCEDEGPTPTPSP